MLDHIRLDKNKLGLLVISCSANISNPQKQDEWEADFDVFQAQNIKECNKTAQNIAFGALQILSINYCSLKFIFALLKQ